MRNLVTSLFVAFICLHASASENLKIEAAVRIAEKFVAENGYTNLPKSRVNRVLDSESLERSADREKLLADRFDTLMPSAIGAKRGRKNERTGWSVAFDFTAKFGAPNLCRVVTMTLDGSNVRVEHVDGVRKYFVGFEND